VLNNQISSASVTQQICSSGVSDKREMIPGRLTWFSSRDEAFQKYWGEEMCCWKHAICICTGSMFYSLFYRVL